MLKTYQIVVVGDPPGAFKTRQFDESIFASDEKVLGRDCTVDDVALRLEVRQSSNGLDTNVEQRLDVVWGYGSVAQTVPQSAAVVAFRHHVERTF